MRKYTGFIKIATLIVVFPIIIWKLSLKKTYMLYRENEQAGVLLNEIESMKQNPQEPSAIIFSPILSNGKLLEIIEWDTTNSSIGVIQYNPVLIKESENIKLYSGVLVLQGGFADLIKLIDKIEKKRLPIKLSSISFTHEPLKEKSANRIELTLIFQQIEI